MKMTDVGQSAKEAGFVTSSKDEEKEKKHYPTMFLSTKEVPGLKGSKPGDKGEMLVAYEIKSQRIDDEDKASKYDIEIKKIGIKGSVDEETKELKKDVSERLKAGREKG